MTKAEMLVQFDKNFVQKNDGDGDNFDIGIFPSDIKSFLSEVWDEAVKEGESGQIEHFKTGAFGKAIRQEAIEEVIEEIPENLIHETYTKKGIELRNLKEVLKSKFKE